MHYCGRAVFACKSPNRQRIQTKSSVWGEFGQWYSGRFSIPDPSLSATSWNRWVLKMCFTSGLLDSQWHSRLIPAISFRKASFLLDGHHHQHQRQQQDLHEGKSHDFKSRDQPYPPMYDAEFFIPAAFHRIQIVVKISASRQNASAPPPQKRHNATPTSPHTRCTRAFVRFLNVFEFLIV